MESSLNQEQLFAAGPVRIKSRRHRSSTNRKRHIFDRLVGEGRVRYDPVTGKHYECKGGGQVKRAYRRDCECGAEWWASDATYRKTAGLCSQCRWDKRRLAERAPVGTRRSASGQGYIVVKTAEPDTWMLEHRAAMQQAIGRELAPTETVHHINGQRDDNRIENLQLRRGHHGPGQAHQCGDCGSINIIAIEIADHHPPAGGVRENANDDSSPRQSANTPPI